MKEIVISAIAATGLIILGVVIAYTQPEASPLLYAIIAAVAAIAGVAGAFIPKAVTQIKARRCKK